MRKPHPHSGFELWPGDEDFRYEHTEASLCLQGWGSNPFPHVAALLDVAPKDTTA